MQTIDMYKESVQSDVPLDELQQYVALTKELGITSPKARLESLKAFLSENGITVYPLEKVDAYLREKAQREGGPSTVWCWKPMRQKDARATWVETAEQARELQRQALQSAQEAQVRAMQNVPTPPGMKFVDYGFDRLARKSGKAIEQLQREADNEFMNALSRLDLNAVMFGARPQLKHGTVVNSVYLHAIPFACLLTVKKIADAFPDAQFLVSDYEVQRPDPFLAVTLPDTPELFVIERWDEPGFRM